METPLAAAAAAGALLALARQHASDEQAVAKARRAYQRALRRANAAMQEACRESCNRDVCGHPWDATENGLT